VIAVIMPIVPSASTVSSCAPSGLKLGEQQAVSTPPTAPQRAGGSRLSWHHLMYTLPST
jgi:hypothetical protein